MCEELGLSATLTQHHATLEPGRPPPEAPPSGSSRYQRGREIGRGGMGRVVEAVDRQFNRHVAIKELHKDDAGARRRRFESEALITGHLEHPGIPAVHERGVDEIGVPFYVMRKIRGRTLGVLLDEARTLEERLALLPVIIRAAQTVAYAHDQGVVHRDLKPDNIIVGPHGETVVLDWGIARVRGVPSTSQGQDAPGATPLSGGSGTVHGSVVGTPAYMAPEQATGDLDLIDERSDVFALGALLYHVLCGTGPYDAPTVPLILEAARVARYRPVAERERKAPPGLAAICARAMSRAPDQRYENAGAMASALERFEAEAVLGRPSMAVSMFANAVVVLGIAGTVVATLAVARAMPSLREQGQGVYPMLLFALFGVILSGIEWKTKGRYALSSLALVLALVTFVASIAQSVSGMELVLGGLREEVGDAHAWRESFTIGSREALGSLVTGAQLTIVQLFLWGAARRRTALAERLRG
jgi:hypothetical protein